MKLPIGNGETEPSPLDALLARERRQAQFKGVIRRALAAGVSPERVASCVPGFRGDPDDLARELDRFVDFDGAAAA